MNTADNAIPPPTKTGHVAVFDAANSFNQRYHDYVTHVTPAPGASPDAALAQAAHDTLAALLPSLRARFDAVLAESLAGIPPDAAREGAVVGAAVAKAVLELRADDGRSRTPPEYLLPSTPGYWQATPPANAAATFTHYPDVRGFVIAHGRRFLMEAPRPSRARATWPTSTRRRRLAP